MPFQTAEYVSSIALANKSSEPPPPQKKVLSEIFLAILLRECVCVLCLHFGNEQVLVFPWGN